MSVQRIIAPFWRRRWLILTTTLTVMAGTLFWAQRLPTVYESSLTLAANSKDGNPLPPGQLARVRRELRDKAVIYPVVESDLFSAQRAAGLSNDALVDQIQNSLSLTEHPHGSSAVIHLSYLHPKAERAQAMAAVIGQTIEAAEAQNGAEGVSGFRVEQPAKLSPRTINPRMSIIMFFALWGGISFGLVLTVVSELVGGLRRWRQPRFY